MLSSKNAVNIMRLSKGTNMLMPPIWHTVRMFTHLTYRVTQPPIHHTLNGVGVWNDTLFYVRAYWTECKFEYIHVHVAQSA